MDTGSGSEMLRFVKLMSDADRLKIAALLSLENLALEEIAQRVELDRTELVRHLDLLEEAGLVRRSQADQPQRYELDRVAFESLVRRQLSTSSPAVPQGGEYDDEERKVLRTYLLPDGRLKQIPNQQKKLKVILSYLTGAFEPGKHYTEKEVNQILVKYHEDTAALRRYLVDYRILSREKDGSSYWRS